MDFCNICYSIGFRVFLALVTLVVRFFRFGVGQMLCSGETWVVLLVSLSATDFEVVGVGNLRLSV